MKGQLAAAVCALLPLYAAAQPAPLPPSVQTPSVQATGEAVIQTKPDQASLSIGVVTRASTAQAAAADNASLLQATLDDLHKAVGAAGQIQTSGYLLTPNYRSPQGDGPPSIASYTASNTIEVITSDLAGLGKLIDTVVAGGANRIQGVQFAVKDEAPARAQALAEAVRQARGNAQAMAAAMGMQLGRVLLLEQGSQGAVRPVFRQFAAAATAAPTQIQPGTIEVRATVTLTMEVH